MTPETRAAPATDGSTIGPWTWETLPPELVVLHDKPGGTSLRGLAGILNAYDSLRTTAPTDGEEEPHRLTVELVPVHHPATWAANADPAFTSVRDEPRYTLTHTPACDALKYGQRCPFDDGDTVNWPTVPGQYEGWFWSSKSWGDSGWEYDAGIDWRAADNGPGAAQSAQEET